MFSMLKYIRKISRPESARDRKRNCKIFHSVLTGDAVGLSEAQIKKEHSEDQGKRTEANRESRTNCGECPYFHYKNRGTGS